jgi:hypothetical protein
MSGQKKKSSAKRAAEPMVYELPYDVNTAYREAVKKLGLSKGFQTSQCPHCGKLLWSKSEVLEAKL